MYGPAEREESIATIHAALDAGVNLLDTGDFYGMGHNEMLIGEAIRDRNRDQFLISVKFGAQRGPEGSWLGYDARPQAVKTWLAYTLNRLGTDYVDVYRPARLDQSVPIEETVGAIAEMVEAGLRAPDRPVRGRRRDDPQGARDPPDQRPADRVLADLARDRGRDPAGLPRAGDLDHRLRRALAGADQRPLVARARLRGKRLPRPQPALSGREPRAQPRPGRGAACDRRAAGRERRPGRDRLGARPGRGDSAADRRPHVATGSRSRWERWSWN